MVTTSCQGFVWTLLKWQMCCCWRLNSHCYPMVGINSSNLIKGVLIYTDALDEFFPDLRSLFIAPGPCKGLLYTSTVIGIVTYIHIYLNWHFTIKKTTIPCEQWPKPQWFAAHWQEYTTTEMYDESNKLLQGFPWINQYKYYKFLKFLSISYKTPQI